jgi:hypothetical protein
MEKQQISLTKSLLRLAGKEAAIDIMYTLVAHCFSEEVRGIVKDPRNPTQEERDQLKSLINTDVFINIIIKDVGIYDMLSDKNKEHCDGITTQLRSKDGSE